MFGSGVPGGSEHEHLRAENCSMCPQEKVTWMAGWAVPPGWHCGRRGAERSRLKSAALGNRNFTSLCRKCSSLLPLGPDQVDFFVCFYENVYLWKSFRFRADLLAVAGVRAEGGCLALGLLRAAGGRGSVQKGRRPDQSSGPRHWPCGALGFLIAGVMGGLRRQWEGAEHPPWPCHLLRGACLHS